MNISTALFKRKALISFSAFALFLVLPVSASAYTLDPSDINIPAGTSGEVKILAKVSDGSNGVALNLEFTGLEVTNLTLPTGILSIGTCTGQKKFTTTNVCMDVASTNPFTDGQLLATVMVRRVDNSTAVITAVGENKYSKGTTVSGVVAQSGGIPTGVNLASSNLLAILVIAAFAVLALGVAAVAVRKASHKAAPVATPPMV